jgi:hypothetical protein
VTDNLVTGKRRGTFKEDRAMDQRGENIPAVLIVALLAVVVLTLVLANFGNDAVRVFR